MARASDVSSAASDLVVMASLVRDHPHSRLHRSALAHAAGEVIRASGDAVVLTAIELAPDVTIARAIRQAAEAACETVSISSNGMERRARLFSIALVVRLAEAYPTQELDDRLAPILGTGSLLARVQELGARQHVRSFIWPQFWAFDDLSRLSLTDVRQQTIKASTTSTPANGAMLIPRPRSASAQRRCATCLRYLIGYQVGSDMTSGPSSNRPRFVDCVRGVMRASLSEAQDIAVVYDGRFYGPLWHGLRVYQADRLSDVVAALSAQGISATELAASVLLTESRGEICARIAFLRGGKRLDQPVYRILLEPQADPVTAVTHVVAPLRRLGVNVHVTRHAATIPLVDRHELERSRRVAPRFELTLPL